MCFACSSSCLAGRAQNRGVPEMGKKEKAAKVATDNAAQVKGVAKKKQHVTKKDKKQKKVAAESYVEDIGVVAKKKKRFFAVAVGTQPCTSAQPGVGRAGPLTDAMWPMYGLPCVPHEPSVVPPLVQAP